MTPDTEMEVELDGRGMPISIGNQTSSLRLASWSWTFEIDGIDHSLPPLASMPASVTARGNDRSVSSFEGPLATIQWSFRPVAGADFVECAWSIVNTSDRSVRLGAVLPANLILAQRYDTFEYRAAADAPFGIVMRSHDASLWIISENPLVRFGIGDTQLDIRFRANIDIGPGQTFVGESLYVVPATRTGHVVGRNLPKANGDVVDRGGLPNPLDRVLDMGEIEAARTVMAWRLPRRRRGEAFVDADWINALHPDHLGTPNHSRDPVEIAEVQRQYSEVMDQMAVLGVDRIVIDQALATEPGNRIPSDATRGWEIDSVAMPIVDEARRRSYSFGLYNGCGNWPQEWDISYSASLAFLQDQHLDWKVLDADGNPYLNANPTHRLIAASTGGTQVNCLAHRAFREWFVDAVSSTITRHGLTWWGWDIDSAWQFDLAACWSSDHDHGPGSTVYSLWRAMREVEDELRRRHPDLWIMNYWGRKQLGPFGLTGCDLNENGYEYLGWWPSGGQIETTLGEDLAGIRFGWYDDSLAWRSCNDLRLQYWYNAVDRFLPNHLTYAPFNEGLVELIAAIATGGAIAIYDLIEPDQVSTVRDWLGFHRDEIALLDLGSPLWGPPRRGGVDGWWHTDGSRALAFLFNPNPVELAAEIPIGAIGGLQGSGPWTIRRRCPSVGPTLAFDGKMELTAPVALPIGAGSWAVVEVESVDSDRPQVSVEAIAEAPDRVGQPAFWDARALDAYEGSLPPMPASLLGSNVTATALYGSRFF